MRNRKQKIYIQTTGCLSLRMDTSRIENYLRHNNYIIIDNPEKADTILLTPCVVTEDKEKLSFNILSKYNRGKKKNIVIAGCGAKALPEHFSAYTVLRDENEIESIFPPTKIRLSEVGWNGNSPDFGYIPEYIESSIDNYKIFENVLLRLGKDFASSFRYGTMGFEFTNEIDPFYRVFISRGCNFRCSFCIVWKGRGSYKSTPIDLVISQINKGYLEGYRKFMLVADELSSYGIDIKGKFLLGNLLNEIYSRFPDIKLGLRYLEPMRIERLWDDIKDYITDEKVLYLNIPIQSSSEVILEKMNRPKNLNKLKEIIKEIRKTYTGPILTHVIVGFPYETKDDIIRTSNYLIDADFDDVSIHIFSPRSGSKLEKEKINDNWEEHKKILEECRKYTRTRYLKKILLGLKDLDGKVSKIEKEFRYPITILPPDFLNYLKKKEWSEKSQEVDIVLMNSNLDDFVVRLRKSTDYYLQFKIKKEQRVWDEVSIRISKNEITPIFETLNEFLEPTVVVMKKRKSSKENEEITVYIDEVQDLGTFVEIEGENETVDEFMYKFKIDQNLSVEPYGRLILQKPFDLDKSVTRALNLMTK